MLPSVLTAFLFAASGICGRRAAVAFGSLRGNTLRLALSVLVLGLAAGGLGGVGFDAPSTHRLLLSGIIGFGIGDVALFLAYPLLGARQTLLINLCSAPLFGALGDWMLVGTGVTLAQMLATGIILTGVTMALRSKLSALDLERAPRRWEGWVFALLAGLGQGGGAAVTRFAHAAMRDEGAFLHPMQQAFVRTIPGLMVSVLVWATVSFWRRRVSSSEPAQPDEPGSSMPHRWWWLLGASTFGPTLGVSAFQWALGSAPTAVVLSIVATTPIIIIPLAALIEKDSPGKLAFAGSCLGVAGVVLMIWVSRY